MGSYMTSREAAKMGDILATEADLLGMIKEVIFALLRIHTVTRENAILQTIGSYPILI